MAHQHFSNNNNGSSNETPLSRSGLRIGKTWVNPATEQEEFVCATVLWADNMKETKVYGDGEFQENLRHGNDLQRTIKQILDSMSPGETRASTLEVVFFKGKEQSNNHEELTWNILES